MDTLRQDLRFALRAFRKHPGFAAVAVLTLALGIGANTAIFSVVNAVLIRSLPYEQPESLVVLWGNVQRVAVERRGASFPDYADWRAQNQSFEDVAAYSQATFTLSGGDEPERIDGEEVAPAYFRLLRVQPLAGRLFHEDEQRPGGPLVALIGHGLWMRRFGADPSIVGKAITLSGRSFTVAGILPRGFRGLTDGAEVWVTPAIETADDLASRGSRSFPVLARLKPGVSIETAQADLTQVSRNLERAYPATNDKRGVELVPLTTDLFGEIREALLVVLGAVGVVLLIACANVASLLLARAETRQREMAIRTAMGAGRARLLRQLVIEGLVLTLTAGILGVLIAGWAADALIAFSPVTFPGFVHVQTDRTVLIFTLAVSTVMGLLLGLAPMWQIGSGSLAGTLKEAGRGTVGAGRLLFRQSIVTIEIALAVILLVGAGLLIRSLLALHAIDPGFETARLLTMRVSLPAPPPSAAPAGAAAGGGAATASGAAASGAAASGAAVSGAAGSAAAVSASQSALAILERITALPGVERGSVGSSIPLSGEASAISYGAEGQSPTDAQNRPRAYVHRVTPGFFATLGMRLVAGRDFEMADVQQADSPAVIVGESVTTRFWPNQDPIGKRIRPGGPASTAPWLTIVGVVRDTTYRALPRNPTADPDLFFPLRPQTRAFALFVRTRVPPETLVESVRRAARDVEPAATIYNVAPMEARVWEQTARPRFVGWLMGAFAGLALLLAAIGVYGVLAQAVTRRTQEIGLRMALGAGRTEIMALVLRRGLGLVAAGLALGAVGALLLTRLIQSLLFGVSQTDPLTFLGVIGLLAAVALMATWIPARRAMRVDPLVALRHE